MEYLTIHHSKPSNTGFVYYAKNSKTYSEFEYFKMMRRKHQIKENIKEDIQMIVFILLMIFRAYVFLEYGV